MARYFRIRHSEDGWSVESRRDASGFWTLECVVEHWLSEAAERAYWPTEIEATAALTIILTAEVHKEAAGQIAARLRHENPHWSEWLVQAAASARVAGSVAREAEQLALAA